MISWFRRRGPSSNESQVVLRESTVPTTRVDFAELASDTSDFLGQSAYLQLAVFQQYSAISRDSGRLLTTELIAGPAGLALRKHHELVGEIRRRGEDPQLLMAPYVPAIDRLLGIARGDSINEGLLGLYITQGFLDDFFRGLAARLPADLAPRMERVLGADNGSSVVVGILRDAIIEDPRRAHRLALSGRRLVGDIMLVCHAALRLEPVGTDTTDRAPGNTPERVEPVFTELIGRHTQRMDALGLTA
ncbi:hypothetical protein D9V34_00595 [Mycetocola lacteus]|uniref:Ferritin-like domain-containing protein n=1 Tax=Mycetocola lacteus TaxID=76637 RepID=A0A3L7AXA8_9MICO|nr:ferritin-like fold-containing protein [Mycetocola lacteus]RLP80750.1 hypothetical protein D9V34_12890 [Mycetocola lacteus]RLP84535.1 hypothetical protein D9V34_00595 [Mycetocola lacteus]